MKQADILEIFLSIQGEGPYVGERQIFLRFNECNLRCGFCDVTGSKKAKKHTVNEILSKIITLNKNTGCKTISLTGGEPLLYSDFLKILLPGLKASDFKIYLETNATLPVELKKIKRYVNVVSADIKLPSVTNDKPQWNRHLEFLKISPKNKTFIKVIVSSQVKLQEFKMAVSMTRKINSKMPFIIQPVTKGRTVNISADKLFELQDYARSYLSKVLVIPQIHKILGVK